MWRMDLRAGDIIKIGDASIKVESKSGQLTRISVVAPKTTKIERVTEKQLLADIKQKPVLGIQPGA